jgi:hypothetical protein
MDFFNEKYVKDKGSFSPIFSPKNLNSQPVMMIVVPSHNGKSSNIFNFYAPNKPEER